MRVAISSFDWRSTRLGDPDDWPASLRTILNLVLDAPFAMLIMWGPDLIQIYNGGYVPIFGDKHPRALGQPAAECWADIWSDVGPLLLGVYERGEAVFFENLPLRMERGGRHEEAFFTFSYSPIRDGDTIAGLICVVNETTAHVLRERETVERAEALAAVDRAKTQFFNNISHEFRTPLTLMLGPLETLARTLHDFDARQQADLARRNAVRLQKLVNALLDFSLAQSGIATAQRELLDIDRVTGELVSEFRSAYERAGLRLEFQPGVGASAPLDAVMYEKVVLNLLSNALKFTFDGGVTVTTARTAEDVILRVRDTGIGISGEDLPHLFQRFSRVSGARSRTHEGTGIGLALVHEIVGLHGGRIDVESTVAAGTTFVVRFPATAPFTAPESAADTSSLRQSFREEAKALVRASSPSPVTRPTADATRVLVADDNADLREYLANLLGARYAVTVAVDGADLLERAERERPDLIIADVMMPNVDGFSATKQLRQNAAIAHIPIILLTARAGNEASAEALECGADDYILKPFVASDLVARVDALLRRRSHFDGRDAVTRRDIALLAAIADRLISISGTADVWNAATSVLSAFADWVVVYAPQDDGRLDAVSIAHAEPQKVQLGRVVERKYPYYVGDGSGQSTVFLTGKPLLVPHIDSSDIVRMQRDQAHGEILRALNLRSMMLVPVLADGRAIAVISVVRSEQGSPFDERDLLFLQHFAQRCALAFEKARTHERERTIAETLQRALLPAALPVVDGLRFSAAYVPAAREHLVGGDWYDAVMLDTGTVFLSIGDVVGHGLEAAIVMGNLRQTARGLAVDGRGLDAILVALNRLILAEYPNRLATAFVALFDPQTLAISVATAGHPSALRLDGDSAHALLARGMLLGVDPEATFEARTYEVDPGDVIALFTDGFMENDRDIIEGERKLIAALRRGCSAVDPATAVHLDLLGGAAPRDDAALLVVTVEPHLAGVDLTVRAAPEVAPLVRTALRRFLAGTPLPEERQFEMLVAAGEALINAIEHGSHRDDRRSIRIRGSRAGDEFVVEIEDDGRWASHAHAEQRGYGLPLMHAFSDTVDIERQDDGTRVRLRTRFRRELPRVAPTAVSAGAPG